MPKDEYDFGLDDLDFGLNFGKKETKKPLNSKDDFGMNQLAEDMKGDLAKTVEDTKKDFVAFKNDILSMKKEFYDPISGFLKERKALKQLKNLQIFGENLRWKLKQKEVIGVQGDH